MKTSGLVRRRLFVAMLLATLLLANISVPVGLAQTAPGDTKFDPKDLTGQWQGTTQTAAQPQGLRVVFVVTKGDGGAWKTIFNYIDLIAQGQGIPRTANLTLQGSAVEIKVPGNGGVYQGQLSADGKTITGTWAQTGPEMTLNLVRTTPETAWEIPKPPPPPKPMAKDANPSFEVATIKPSKPEAQGKGFGINGRRFTTFNTSLTDLIVFAYDVQKNQILNGPDWIDKDKYDITGVPDAEGSPSNQQWKGMVQKLLADRFQLVFHHDTKEMPVYILAVAKGGPKNLSKSDSTTDGFSVPIRPVPGGLTMPIRNALMTDFTGFALQGAVLDRPVLDHTGIAGRYDFTLTWAPLGTEFGGMLPPPQPTDNPPAGLFTAIQEQLGLTLTPTKAPADVMAIDKAEKPSAN